MAGRAKHTLITDNMLRSLRKRPPPAKPVLIYDKVLPQMILRWSPAGALTWGVKARMPRGRSKVWRSLGTVYVSPREPKAKPEPEVTAEPKSKPEVTAGALTIAEARLACRRHLEQRANGIDPRQEARKRTVEAAQRLTFPQLREAYLKAFATKKKHGEATRILHREFDEWKEKYADEIDAGDVEAAIQVIVDRGSRYQAHNAFGYVRSMYSWAKGRPSMRIKANPCDGMKIETIAGKKKVRTRVLNDHELRAVWNACGGMGYPYGPIIRLLILTGVRENQIGGMRRSEIIETTEDSQMLVFPSERMKGEEDDPPPPHEVPVTATMAEILDSLPRFDGAHLFTTTAGAKPVNGWSKAKARIDRLSGVADWIFHDLRRSARTRISAIPAEEHVREALVAHGRRGIQAHYDQHKYRAEKRRLLGQWERRLYRVVNPPKPPSAVTNIDEARAKRAS
jgi:integrase